MGRRRKAAIAPRGAAGDGIDGGEGSTDAQGPAERRDLEAEHEEKEAGKLGFSFYCCYLLCSLSPSRKGHTYIGFTVNPKRRIKQHNGVIRCGAFRTKHGRPWEMVLCIYGFPSNVSALQFEWAWQHPLESLAVRKAAATFKSLGGIANKIKLAYTMLNLTPWENLSLTVNIFSTKYAKFIAGCPSLPAQMKTVIRAMDDLPCYSEGLLSESDNEFQEVNTVDTEFIIERSDMRATELPAHHTPPRHTSSPGLNFSHDFHQPMVCYTEEDETDANITPSLLGGDNRISLCSRMAFSPIARRLDVEASSLNWMSVTDGNSVIDLVTPCSNRWHPPLVHGKAIIVDLTDSP